MKPLAVIVAETEAGRISPLTWELLALVRELRRRESLALQIWQLGDRAETEAALLARETGEEVLAICGRSLREYSARGVLHALLEVLKLRSPRYLLLASTTRGAEIAPALAVRWPAACLTQVESVVPTAEGMAFRRSILKGKRVMSCRPRRYPLLLTVEPGAFRAEPVAPEETGSVTVHQVAPDRPIGVPRRSGGSLGGLNLAEADVIVAAGMGIGAPEHLELIRRLAALFRRSAIGATRRVCDQGWLGYEHQVGMTGRTVSPRLYIACGLSGTLQHTVGMKGATWIVAVNRDPGAPIFRIAHMGVVEDLHAFLPCFLTLAEAPPPTDDRLDSAAGSVPSSPPEKIPG